MVDKKDKIDKIKNLVFLKDAIIEDWKKIEKLFVADMSGGIGEKIGMILDLCTNLTSAEIGDEENWLEWFLWDNDSGRKGLRVSLKGKRRQIKSVEDLVEII